MQPLKPPYGAVQKTKRIGRGPGSGMGKTSTRGHKGQRSRKGSSIKVGFEGGQTPLIRRIPKRGFDNTAFRDIIVEINVYMLNKFENGAVINIDEFKKSGLLNKIRSKIKILGNGVLEKKIEVHAHKFTKQAIEKIEKAGGKAVIIQ